MSAAVEEAYSRAGAKYFFLSFSGPLRALAQEVGEGLKCIVDGHFGEEVFLDCSSLPSGHAIENIYTNAARAYRCGVVFIDALYFPKRNAVVKEIHEFRRSQVPIIFIVCDEVIEVLRAVEDSLATYWKGHANEEHARDVLSFLCDLLNGSVADKSYCCVRFHAHLGSSLLSLPPSSAASFPVLCTSVELSKAAAEHYADWLEREALPISVQSGLSHQSLLLPSFQRSFMMILSCVRALQRLGRIVEVPEMMEKLRNDPFLRCSGASAEELRASVAETQLLMDDVMKKAIDLFPHHKEGVERNLKSQISESSCTFLSYLYSDVKKSKRDEFLSLTVRYMKLMAVQLGQKRELETVENVITLFMSAFDGTKSREWEMERENARGDTAAASLQLQDTPLILCCCPSAVEVCGAYSAMLLDSTPSLSRVLLLPELDGRSFDSCIVGVILDEHTLAQDAGKELETLCRELRERLSASCCVFPIVAADVSSLKAKEEHESLQWMLERKGVVDARFDQYFDTDGGDEAAESTRRKLLAAVESSTFVVCSSQLECAVQKLCDVQENESVMVGARDLLEEWQSTMKSKRDMCPDRSIFEVSRDIVQQLLTRLEERKQILVLDLSEKHDALRKANEEFERMLKTYTEMGEPLGEPFISLGREYEQVNKIFEETKRALDAYHEVAQVVLSWLVSRGVAGVDNPQ